MKVEFMKNAEEIKLLAIFLSQLAREGVAYEVSTRERKIDVIITGF